MEWLREKVGSPKEVFTVFEESLEKGLLKLTLELTGGAKEVHIPDMPLPKNSIRKSFVIGRQTLQAVNKQARRRKIKRDVLVNYFLLSHKKGLEEGHKRLFEKQKKAQEFLGDFRNLGSKVKGEIRELLGEDDPIFRAFSAEFGWLEDQVLSEVKSRLEDGEPITEPLSNTYR